MQIRKLVIYGFGRHEDRIIEIDSELAIFHGPNEAGKTTIQQFIIQTLFGYPVRGGASRRYEPKAGGRFGGQLHIEDADFGTVIIERVNGKSAGEVTVYFEDGSRGGEPALQKVLRGADRASFEAVFAFSVHELQGLERMTEEELSRTLLASGTTGMDTALQLADRLEKDMGQLFKPNGRNPEMNRLMDELRTTETELHKIKNKSQVFMPAADRMPAIDGLLVQLAAEEQRIKKQMKETEKWLQAAPLVARKNQLRQMLAELPATPFPADGRNRLERLAERLEEASAAANVLGEELKTQQKPEPPDSSALERLLTQEAEWHRERAAIEQKRDDQTKLEDERNRLIGLLGMDEAEVLAADVSIRQEEELKRLVAAAAAEEENRRFWQRQLDSEKIKLAEQEADLDRLMRNAPDDEELEQAEEWQRISAEFAEARAARTLGKTSQPLASYGVAAFGAVCILIGLINGHLLWFAGAAAFLAIAGWLYKTGSKGLPEHYEKLLQQYEGREAELNALVTRTAGYHSDIQQLEGACDRTADKVERLIKEEPETGAAGQFRKWLIGTGLPVNTGRQTAVSLLEKLRDLQAVSLKLERVSRELDLLTEKVQQRLLEAEAAGIVASADELYTLIRTECRRRQDQQLAFDQQEEKREKTLAEHKKLETLCAKIKQEIQSLLQEAGVEDESAFYRLSQQAAEWNRLLQELRPIEDQLNAFGEIQEPEDTEERTAGDMLIQCEERLKQLEMERKELLQERAEKVQMLEHLMTDGSLADKQQQLEAQKAELAALAQKWAVDRAIAEAIRRTLDELKEKRLPAVLAGAQAIFSRLTGSAYNELAMAQDGYFEAVRTDGFRFRITELSQATKEQAYLALRLALAASLKTEQPFPVLLDDPFVHFDRSRLLQMISLMREMKANHQFIYFTCHDTITSLLPEAQVIEVAAHERSVKV
ncbi:ATP-binding protein [Planococcus lenghuensis]|uniref:YhaN AAA domain-containing protein n=1 Tax=Planococcus lenghuensis TaxID=2213202 RepID=A0A1Q2KXK7_9BACL|nr:AAA family ATPase [Planococcus lenghuensis]AQQ52547.1 hypothetical protein B0X71_05180 [Planococcus lenghuensis]